jgi:hypothetical protein
LGVTIWPAASKAQSSITAVSADGLRLFERGFYKPKAAA